MEMFEDLPIDSFRAEYAFLSNFYPCPISYKGNVYPTLENAYQAAKFQDPRTRGAFVNCPPGIAKRKARFYVRRDDWEDVKVTVMGALLREKFSPADNPELCKMLLSTGSRKLIEGNTWGDTFWGVCNGQGDNMLGVLLMQVRDRVRAARR